MARRTITLDVTALRRVRPDAEPCLRWKYDWLSAQRTAKGDTGAALERWISDVEEHWGVCGQVLEVDDEPVAYALYAPPAFLPGLGDVPTAPPSPDAVVLAEMYVGPHAGGFAAAKHLVQSVAADLHGRDVVALEAFGTVRETDVEPDDETTLVGVPGDRCLLAVDFLDAVGFTTHRAHGTTPRMRMELRGARTWMSEVEHAWERLVGAVRPVNPGLGAPTVKSDSLESEWIRSGPRAP